jgi:hypothetical protein
LLCIGELKIEDLLELFRELREFMKRAVFCMALRLVKTCPTYEQKVTKMRGLLKIPKDLLNYQRLESLVIANVTTWYATR